MTPEQAVFVGWALHYASISVVQLDKWGNPVVERHNDTVHLAGTVGLGGQFQ